MAARALRPGRAHRLKFFRVLDGDTPFASAIAELFFDLVGHIASAHHQIADSLMDAAAAPANLEMICRQPEQGSWERSEQLNATVFPSLRPATMRNILIDAMQPGYITRSQCSNHGTQRLLDVLVGFQPVSLRILSVLPKMIFSSDGRMNCCAAGLRLSLRKDGSPYAAVRQFRKSWLRRGYKLPALPFHRRQHKIRAPYR